MNHLFKQELDKGSALFDLTHAAGIFFRDSEYEEKRAIGIILKSGRALGWDTDNLEDDWERLQQAYMQVTPEEEQVMIAPVCINKADDIDALNRDEKLRFNVIQGWSPMPTRKEEGTFHVHFAISELSSVTINYPSKEEEGSEYAKGNALLMLTIGGVKFSEITDVTAARGIYQYLCQQKGWTEE